MNNPKTIPPPLSPDPGPHPHPMPTPGQASRELARRSLEQFAALLQPSLALTPFHRNYYRVLDAFARGHIRRLIVTMPPQHGKSTGSSLLLPAYLLGLQPRTRIALASYSLALASRFNRRVQQLIDTPLYGRIFPGTRLKASGPGSLKRNAGAVRTREEFELLDQRGGLLSVGREGPLTGNAVDVFILDDLYKDALEANSPLIRENAWEWYTSVVRTRLHNDSRELLVFTRWHEDDLVGRLAKHETLIPLHDLSQLENVPPGAWLHLHLEALQGSLPTPLDPRPRGKALWPERHSAALLAEKRRLDSRTFETLYQGRPSPTEGLLYGAGFSTYDELPERIVKWGNYTDTADTGEDYLCSVCYALGADGLIYVTGVVYTPEPMEVSETLVAELLRESGTRTARIESNNGGRGFARAIARALPSLRVEWFHQGRNKEARILSHSATVLQLLRLPWGWEARWPQLHADLSSYRRLWKANRRHDAPDVLTGIIETETDLSGQKKIRAVGFSSPSR